MEHITKRTRTSTFAGSVTNGLPNCGWFPKTEWYTARAPNQDPMRAAIAHGLGQRHGFFGAWQLAEHAYTYASWSSKKEFMKEYRQVTGDRHMYEIILPNLPVHLCIDIDLKVELNEYSTSTLLEDSLASITRALRASNYVVDEDRFRVLTSNRSIPIHQVGLQYKLSYHITHPDIVFSSFAVQGAWVKKNLNITGVDQAIYTDNRLMRMVGSSKVGTDVQLTPAGGKALELDPEYLVTYNASIASNSPKKQDEYKQVRAMLRNLDPNSTVMENGANKYLVRKIGYFRTCPYGVKHDSQNANVKIDKNNVVWYNCYTSDPTHACHKKSFKLGELGAPPQTLVEEQTYNYNNARVEPYKFATKILCVKSHCGTGKSFQARELIGRILLSKMDARICIVSPRISFSSAIAGAFSQHKFVRYNEIDVKKDSINKHNKIIVQYESLHLLDRLRFDLVILDEVETIMSCAISSATNKNNLLLNSRIFKTLVSSSDKTLVMDADLCEATIDMMRSLGSVTLHVNSHQPLPRTFGCYDQSAVWLKRLEDKLRDGRRLVIPVTSKAFADTYILPLLEQYIPGEYIYYHVDNKDIRDTLADIETEWAKYKVVMYTPCINVGCDFSTPGHFDEIWGVASVQSSVPREFFQMLVRCRNPKNSRMHILIATSGSGEKSEQTYQQVYDEVQRSMFAKIGVRSDMERLLLGHAQLSLDVVGNMMWTQAKDDWLTTVYLHRQTEARMDFMTEVKRLCALKEYKFVQTKVALTEEVMEKMEQRQASQKDARRSFRISQFDRALVELPERDIEAIMQDFKTGKCTEHETCLVRAADYVGRFQQPVDGEHYVNMEHNLAPCYNIRRLMDRTPEDQLKHEHSYVDKHDQPQVKRRHEAVQDVHFHKMMLMQKVSTHLGLQGPLDTDTALTQSDFVQAATPILAMQKDLSSVFDLKFRTSEETEEWKMTKTIANQLFTQYLGGAFKVVGRRREDGEREHEYALQFKSIYCKGDELVTYMDVANQLNPMQK